MTSAADPDRSSRAWPWVVVVVAAALGLGLITDQAVHSSATYDEVTYLKVAARWWRTGEQEVITRMGTPLTFWKLQQAPTLWVIDHFGDRSWIDDPITHQAQLLPWVRVGASWAWLGAFGVTVVWARSWYGERAMALAAVLFALSPNLLAHGALATMELPLVASSGAMVACFARFLETGNRRWFWASAVAGGLAFSCKYTTVVIPPILGLIWAVDRFRSQTRPWVGLASIGSVCREVGGGMVAYLAALVLANLIITGFATVQLSPRSGPHPVLTGLNPRVAQLMALALESSFPQDWVGFATQVIFQRDGGPSYLFGERRFTGWWYYYPISLAVKVPLAFWFLALVRSRSRSVGRPERKEWVVLVYAVVFLLVAMTGSKRNYGVRYLLPLAPAALVWVSALANAPRGQRWAPLMGVAGMALAVGSIHPYELAYFNVVAGGPEGGRRILADSNLDWGQGAKAVAHLQAERPEFRDLTWYAFGDTDPAHYGVVGKVYRFDAHRPPTDLPPRLAAATTWLAVSASLQWGPWGPPDYFGHLRQLPPARYSADRTVAFYRTADLDRPGCEPVSTGRGPE